MHRCVEHQKTEGLRVKAPNVLLSDLMFGENAKWFSITSLSHWVWSERQAAALLVVGSDSVSNGGNLALQCLKSMLRSLYHAVTYASQPWCFHLLNGGNVLLQNR